MLCFHITEFPKCRNRSKVLFLWSSIGLSNKYTGLSLSKCHSWFQHIKVQTTANELIGKVRNSDENFHQNALVFLPAWKMLILWFFTHRSLAEGTGIPGGGLLGGFLSNGRMAHGGSLQGL